MTHQTENSTAYETDGEAIRVAGENAGLYTYFKVGDNFKKYLQHRDTTLGIHFGWWSQTHDDY